MEKIFTRRLFAYMLAALIITITTIFVLQTVIIQRTNTSSSRDKLASVKEKLLNNEDNIARLTNNLSEDNLAKTRAFADMLAADKTLANNTAKLNEIKDRLMVNEIVQEPQRNVAEGVVMQYIGVVRKDAKGLVQVGVRPEVLEDMLASTALDVVLGDMDFGENGYIYAIDPLNGEILSHPNSALIGTPATNAGFHSAATRL